MLTRSGSTLFSSFVTASWYLFLNGEKAKFEFFHIAGVFGGLAFLFHN